MRIRGRKLYPSNLKERRLLLQIGAMPLYVPRGVSPYQVARRLSRAASSELPDIAFVRALNTKQVTSEPSRAPNTAAA
jgi:hypothetical protein